VCSGKAETPGGWTGIGRSVCDFEAGVNREFQRDFVATVSRVSGEPLTLMKSDVPGGTRRCDCLKPAKMLRSSTNMKILWNLPRIFVLVCLLVVSFELHLMGQLNPPPPRTAPPDSGQLPAGTRPGNMAPTGLAANGGSIENGKYINSIYGFSLKTSPGWVVMPSKDAIPLNSDSVDPAIMRAAQLIHPLLIMTENAPLKKSYERKSLQILATRMPREAGLTSAQDYLAYSEKTAKEKGMAVEYVGHPEEVTINGQKLWKIESNETVSGAVQHVEQYVIFRGISLIQFFIVSPDEAGLKEMEPSIQSLEFKPLPQQAAPKRPARKTKPAASPGAKSQ
jgi:hypothetical protein